MRFAKTKEKGVFFISCKNKEGIKELLTEISTKAKSILLGFYNKNDFLLNLRQKNNLYKSKKHISCALQTYLKTQDLSLVLSDLYVAMSFLTNTTKPKDPDYIINKIFKGFCVGK